MSLFNMTFETQSGEVVPGDLTLVGIAGEERISRLYEYELTFEVNDDAGLSPEAQDDLLRNGCMIRIGGDARDETPDEDSDLSISGVLRRLQMLTTASG